ncbi:general substrate transporter [Syncephalastrum racemosum]|uniref:General substrate transporter n=1 Tax=Syncephalastrum racemosum TaxID=13706 RepID=A0A1X2H4R9_SYNRA|nr:general substrate transporter [Syncephalastrum racemosum]
MMSRKRFYCYMCGICTSLCMFINGFDASVFNNLQGIDSFMRYMGLSATDPSDQSMIGAVTSCYMAATIVAGLSVSPLVTHYFGRRASIFLGCFIVIIASFIQTFSPNIGAFIGGRIILGLGQGIALPAGPVFMGELCPPQIRGSMLSFWQMMYSVGALVTSYASYGTIQNIGLGDWQWKTITLIQAAIPFICCATIFTCPESPRWLVQSGKIDKARRALLRLREEHEVELELEEIVAAVEWEKNNTSNSLKDLWRDKTIRKRIYLGLIINFGQQVTGQSMMNNYSTKVYQKVFNSNSTVLLINALNYTFGIIFTLTCTFLSDRLGRVKILIIAGIGQGLMLLIAATVYVTTPFTEEGGKEYGVGISLALLMFLFTFFYKPGWGATVWIYTSEIFPLSVRGTAVSICTNTQNLANVVMAQAFPPMFVAMGFYSFYVWMGVNFVLVIIVYFFYPETKGVSLEEMDALFGASGKTDAVVQKAHQHAEEIKYTHDEKSSTA